jgi:hypothetical protein
MTRPFPGSIAFPVLGAILLVTAAATAACAQSATAPPQAPANPQSSGQTSTTPTTPPKKVWTNENLGGSHTNDSAAPPSNSGSNGGSGEGSGAPAKSKSKKDPRWYHDQIAKLEAQLPALDKSITQLQAALEGKTLNEPLHYGGNRIGDWKEQLQQLQVKRQDIADKITALEDEARHNGVATNALP